MAMVTAAGRDGLRNDSRLVNSSYLADPARGGDVAEFLPPPGELLISSGAHDGVYLR